MIGRDHAGHYAGGGSRQIVIEVKSFSFISTGVTLADTVGSLYFGSSGSVL
jgi:hypothetical protein